jgi:hypothetical protein
VTIIPSILIIEEIQLITKTGKVGMAKKKGVLDVPFHLVEIPSGFPRHLRTLALR